MTPEEQEATLEAFKQAIIEAELDPKGSWARAVGMIRDVLVEPQAAMIADLRRQLEERETDRERTIRLLDDFGVVWREGDKREGDRNAILIEAKAGPKNVGYSYFVTLLEFTDDGEFVAWGCWE